MAFKKFKKFKRRLFKRKQSLSMRAYHRASLALKRAKIPTKYYTTYNATDQAINYSTGLVASMTNIDQGTSENSRIGNSVFIKSIDLRIHVKGNQTSTVNDQCVRVLVVKDKLNTGTVPTLANVLETTGSSLSVISPYSLNNKNDMKRFQILKDKLVNVSKYTQDGSELFRFKLYPNCPVRYTSTTGTDEGPNQIYLMVISNVNTNDCLFSYYGITTYFNNRE